MTKLRYFPVPFQTCTLQIILFQQGRARARQGRFGLPNVQGRRVVWYSFDGRLAELLCSIEEEMPILGSLANPWIALRNVCVKVVRWGLEKTFAHYQVCRLGEPDYNNLYTYHRSQNRSGQERILDYGRDTQGGAMEHLAHVIFGHPLEMGSSDPSSHFHAGCAKSPCKQKCTPSDSLASFFPPKKRYFW